jgi:hypothetical protein
VYDFADIDFSDPRWHRRFRLLMDGVRSQIDQEWLLAKQRHYAAVMLTPGDWDRSNVTQKLEDTFYDLLGSYFPSQRMTAEEREARLAKQASDRWENRWGRRDDPETQAKIQNLVDGLNTLRQQTAAESGNMDSIQDVMRRQARQMAETANRLRSRGS